MDATPHGRQLDNPSPHEAGDAVAVDIAEGEVTVISKRLPAEAASGRETGVDASDGSGDVPGAAAAAASTADVARPKRGAKPSRRGRSAEALIGQSLDHFQILEMVGGGGMGTVFRARDQRLDRTVAVKVIPAEHQDPEMLRRFKLEAQSAARLDHPHIARVYYVGEAHEWNYIVFEYVDGINLRDLVIAKGPLGLDEAVWFTRQVAEALTHASARYVVHRDIKPSNVLVTKRGAVKLVDMGLARTTAIERTSNDLTASNMTLGTFDYISPEQARDPRTADVRSDLYSLGCTLYFLLSGRPPFPDGTALQKLMMHDNVRPVDIRQYRVDVPDELAAILARMMAKNPNHRYQDPLELINDLYLLAEFENLPKSRQAGTVSITPAIQEKSVFESLLPWMVALGMLAGVTLWMRGMQGGKSMLPRERIPYVVQQSSIGAAVGSPIAPAVGGITATAPRAGAGRTSGGQAASGSQAVSGVAFDPQSDTRPAAGSDPGGSRVAAATVSPSTASRSGIARSDTSPRSAPSSMSDVGTSASPTGIGVSEPLAPYETASAAASMAAEAGRGEGAVREVLSGRGGSTGVGSLTGYGNYSSTPSGFSTGLSGRLTAGVNAWPAAGGGAADVGATAAKLAELSADGGPWIIVDERAELSSRTGRQVVRTLQEAFSLAASRPQSREIVLMNPVRITSPLTWEHPNLTIRGGRGRAKIAVAPQADQMPQFDYPAGDEMQSGFRPAAGQTLRLLDVDLELSSPESSGGVVSVFAAAAGSLVQLDRCSVTMLPSISAWRSAVFATPVRSPRDPLRSAEAGQGYDAAASNSAVPLEESEGDQVQLLLADCFVRGDGDFLIEPHAVKTVIGWENGLLAIDGRFLEYGGARTSGRIPLSIRLRLQDVTAAVRRGFARLRYEAAEDNPVCLYATMESCVFLTDADTALFEFEGVEELAKLKANPLDAPAWARWLDVSGVDNAYDTGVRELIRLRSQGRIIARFDFESAIRTLLRERSPEASVRWASPPSPSALAYRQTPAQFLQRQGPFQPGMRPAELPPPEAVNSAAAGE